MAKVVPKKKLLYGAAALFLLLATAYAFSVDIRGSRSSVITGDEPFYLLTTQSILEDGDLNLVNQYAARSYRGFTDYPGELWKQSVPLSDGRLLSPHNPGLSALVLPGFVLAGLRGAQIQLMVMMAATFVLMFILTSYLTRRLAAAWLAAAAVGLSAVPFIYSTEIYPEAPAALVLTGALLLAYRWKRPGPGQSALLALLSSALPWLGVKYLLLAVPVVVFLFLSADHRGRLALSASLAVSAGAYILFHLTTFGTLTPYSSNVVYAGFDTAETLRAHLAFADRIDRLPGLFVDRNFGVGRWAPILLASLPPLALLWMKGGLHRLILIVFVVQVLVAAFVAITMMGWWFPGRTLMTVLPLLVVPLALLMIRANGPVKWAVAALGVYSGAITIALAMAGLAGQITVAVDPFDMSSRAFQVVSPVFPDYTAPGASTMFLTFGWVALGLAAPVLLLLSDGRTRQSDGDSVEEAVIA